MKKYYKTKREAIKALSAMPQHIVQTKQLSVFKMPKGTRKSGWYAVCDYMEFINTY